jgi:hypothetical protein
MYSIKYQIPMIKNLTFFRFKIVLPLLMITGLLGCYRNSHFSTYAEYEAPKSDFKIQIIANGTVPFGHDLSQTL